MLYRNEGEMNFTDVSHDAKIAKAIEPYVVWGDAFLDSDNRGPLDLMLVKGHVYPQGDSAKPGTTYRESKLLFWNNGDGTFREVGRETGTALRTEQVSRGLAVGDRFNLGRRYVVVENLTAGPMILEVKANPKNHWISFRLEGGALNARVYVRTGGVQQMSEVNSGGS